MEGFLTNVLNPKAALFFVALVPQFLGAGAPVVALSAAALVGTVAWFLVVANVVGALRKLFARPGVRRAVDALTGVALVALGLKLATSTRP
ncbi:LysE family translocator [Nonomuraea salmonea]